MDGFEEKLNQILSSPQAMEQIMSLANSLSAPAPEEDSQTPDGQSAPSPPLPDAALLARLTPLLASYRQWADDKTRLLEALRPFLREERAHKLDQAIRIARLSRVIRAAMDLLRGDGDV